jgi:hypothetical protein
MRAPDKTHPEDSADRARRYEADDLLALIERERLVVELIYERGREPSGWLVAADHWDVRAPTLREALRKAAERVRA